MCHISRGFYVCLITLAVCRKLAYNQEVNPLVPTVEEIMVSEVISALALLILVYLLFQEDSVLVRLIKRSQSR